jgi:hypothetical protein
MSIGLGFHRRDGGNVIRVQRQHAVEMVGCRRKAEGSGAKECEQGKQASHGFSLGWAKW